MNNHLFILALAAAVIILMYMFACKCTDIEKFFSKQQRRRKGRECRKCKAECKGISPICPVCKDQDSCKPSCFALDQTIKTDKGIILIKDVKIGDKVLISGDKYDEIIGFLDNR